MGHTIGDGLIVFALAAAFIGYFYFKFRAQQSRLEIIHKERLAAMDKGIPLPELPIDPPPLKPRTRESQHIPLILGILLLALGSGTMGALLMMEIEEAHNTWPLPLPLALAGLGLILYHFLATSRED
jgi:hypothetical protein